MKTKALFVAAAFCFLPASLFPAPATDRQIEDAAKSSYNFRKVLDKNVDVKVRDGVVTLIGTVATDEQRRIAEDTVAHIDGVARVDNQLKVGDTVREGSDEWIALKVRGRLAVRPNVSMTHTDVSVKDGVVTLTGTAESVAQKDLTEAFAKEINGVRGVENRLQVVEPAARAPAEAGSPIAGRREVSTTPRVAPDPSETLADKIDDGSINAQIKFELFAHRSTSGLKARVETRQGRVTITGEAASEAERDLVTKLARNVRGVLDVNNQMTVKKP